MTKTFGATIKLPGVGQQHVLIRANDLWKAKAMLEAQYGRGNVLNVHNATASDLKRGGG
jgi:hypothetical protein